MLLPFALSFCIMESVYWDEVFCMKASKRELAYAAAHFGEVHHTTLNPEGPGVVRIHLVPPVIKNGEIGASVAILNGQDVVPVNTSWSILLTELIEAIKP